MGPRRLEIYRRGQDTSAGETDLTVSKDIEMYKKCGLGRQAEHLNLASQQRLNGLASWASRLELPKFCSWRWSSGEYISS